MVNERRLMVLRVLVVGGFAGLALVAMAVLRPGDESAAVGDVSSTATRVAGNLGPLGDRNATVGEPAPDFRLMRTDGAVVTLGQLTGEPLVVNFWATWCGPCKEEMPLFEAAYSKANGALRIVGVNYREPAGLVEEYRADFGVTFAFLLDTEGTVARQYLAQGLPVTYFIDAGGIVRDFRIGSLTAEMLTEKLATIGIQG